MQKNVLTLKWKSKIIFHCSEQLGTLENCLENLWSKEVNSACANGLISVGGNEGHTTKQNYIFFGGFSSQAVENTLEMYSVFVS